MLLRFQDLTVDLNTHLVTCHQQVIPLSLKEFNLLVYLIKNKNRICSFDELLVEVWQYEPEYCNYHMVTQVVWRLRSKFKQCTCCGKSLTIRTVREVGFCFDFPISDQLTETRLR